MRTQEETRISVFQSGWTIVRAGLKWILIGTLVGLIVGLVGSVFAHVLGGINRFRAARPWIKFGLPIGGLLIVFLYRVFKNTDDRGTNTILSAVHSSGEVPFKMAPLIFVSTTITHLFGGSAGREGAALQLGGSIANKIGKLIRLNVGDQKIIVMCGMSAGFSALFGTPMAAAVFAIEVASVGFFSHAGLLPCVTASMVAHFVADFLNVPPEVFHVAGLPSITAISFLRISCFAALAGAISIVFCQVLHLAEHLYKRFFKNPYIRIGIAGFLVVLLSVAVRTDAYLGSGMGLIEHVFHTGEAKPYDFLLKMVFTALTLAAGFKGGEIVPSFTIGAVFGCTLASIFGLPVSLVAACGMIGVFCGVTNAPLTALLISFELFGFEGMPYYLTTVAVTCLISGYASLYHDQKMLCSKTEL